MKLEIVQGQKDPYEHGALMSSKRDEPILGQTAEMVSFTVRYDAAALERLKRLQDQTQINAREWFRALLFALLESYDERGSVSLPLCVVPREEAEKAGLLKPRLTQSE